MNRTEKIEVKLSNMQQETVFHASASATEHRAEVDSNTAGHAAARRMLSEQEAEQSRHENAEARRCRNQHANNAVANAHNARGKRVPPEGPLLPLAPCTYAVQACA